MQKSFHYYGTYCAAYLAGYSHEECLAIGYCSQLVDRCSKTFLKDVGGPQDAATTQLTSEMARSRASGLRSTSCLTTCMLTQARAASATATSSA